MINMSKGRVCYSLETTDYDSAVRDWLRVNRSIEIPAGYADYLYETWGWSLAEDLWEMRNEAILGELASFEKSRPSAEAQAKTDPSAYVRRYHY